MRRKTPLEMCGRRVFFREGALVLTATALTAKHLLASGDGPRVRVGLLTDLHYAAKPAAGSRHYRETLAKLAEAAAQFDRDAPAFVVELGDLIDAAETVDEEMRYLTTINGAFQKISADRHYVLGNHCVDTLTKAEFLGAVGQRAAYYSFDRGGVHFVVLDACFRSDGEPYGRKNFEWTDANIPAAELEWLATDLAGTTKPVVVFAHQRLDVTTHHSVKNHAEVRAVFETAGNVLAVFQGHSHQNDLQEIGHIRYCTLAAMVEGSGAANNGYALLDIGSDGTIELTGFRRQVSRRFPRSE